MRTCEATVLIVEDDVHKLSALSEFFESEFPCFQCVVARSVNSAIVTLSQHCVDLAVVDMSLPGYDIVPGRRAGVPEGFGGEDVLRFIEDLHPSTYTVVVTQLAEFSDPATQVTKPLGQLATELSAQLGEKYLGLVSYSGRYARWRDELRDMIRSITSEVSI